MITGLRTNINMFLGSVIAQSGGTTWFPESASTTAQEVDKVFYFIFWFSVAFFVLLAGIMFFFIWRYRYRKGVGPQKSPSHSLALELTWTIVPLLILIVVFYMGFRSYLNLATPPENAYEINVTARKWSWSFAYPNGHIDGELHVPVDTPVLLTMTSEDVIHSLFIPDFRIKSDAVPGRYTKTWFEATEPGEHLLFCTEFCGTSHSEMTTTVYVHTEEEFKLWLEDAANFLENLPPDEAGKKLYTSRGCGQCHSVDGSANIGPSFKGIYGQVRMFEDGTQAEADENYLRESIIDPQLKIVKGYDPVMPTYKGDLKDAEITVIIAYIKSLADGGAPE